MNRLLALVLPFLLSTAVLASDRPNFLIILSDDMGFSDLGCYGGEIDTPTLDRLASKGIRFTEFYVTARCWPTRATLMSGHYSNHLQDQQVTIPELLKQGGYQTGMVGKWHLSKTTKENSPMQRGFESFYGTLIGAGSFWHPDTLTRGLEPAEIEEGFYYTDKIGEEGVIQIEQFAKDPSKPFFQYLAFTAPHWPMHAPEATIEKYLDRYTDGWEALRETRYARMIEMGLIDKERWPLPPLEKRVKKWEDTSHKEWHVRNMAVYAAMIDHMDQAIGRVVDALERTGQLDNTFILFTNDNGACPERLSGNGWGTCGNVIKLAKEMNKKLTVGDDVTVPNGGPFTYGSVGPNWAHAQNTPLQKYKANVQEGGACVPAIVHWPKGLKDPGRITRERAHIVDVMATCLDLAGVEYPETWNDTKLKPNHGISFTPILQGKPMNADHPYYFHHGNQGLIQGDWKIVRSRNKPWALYSLKNEKTEITDLASQYPERVQAMAAEWKRLQADSSM